jgi:predicted TIM-barrel fold metal-dependent hydrolase
MRLSVTVARAASAASVALVVGTADLPAQQKMGVEDYEPRSTLVVPEHHIVRARFPFIDVHGHQRRPSPARVDDLVTAMDAMNMSIMVNLSGGAGDSLRGVVDTMKGAHPKRFVVFANVSFDGIDEPGWGERTAAALERDVLEHGAQGLKIFKNLGMFATDSQGRRVATDDDRIDPVWEKCAELGIPVLIHTGEPAPFWSPHDRHNERWLELSQFPNRKRDDTRFASFEQTMAEQHSLFRRHPRTIFIAAHLAWLGNDLEQLGALLDDIPNMRVGIGAVLAELGRQPRAARAFLERYQDRVLFGKDGPFEPSEYHVYFRVLESADEYFDYYRKRHAHWKMYGLALPDEVLRKIYYENALSIIPGLDRSAFPR